MDLCCVFFVHYHCQFPVCLQHVTWVQVYNTKTSLMIEFDANVNNLLLKCCQMREFIKYLSFEQNILLTPTQTLSLLMIFPT